MSGAGLMVVGTLCLALLACIGTLCAFSLIHPSQEVPAMLDRILTGLVASVGTLLAKTYADKRAYDDDEPVQVEASNPLPVRVEDAPAAGAADTTWQYEGQEAP